MMSIYEIVRSIGRTVAALVSLHMGAAPAAEFRELKSNAYPNGSTWINGISSDGGSVAGWAADDGNWRHSVLWNLRTGDQTVIRLADKCENKSNEASGVSGDGKTLFIIGCGGEAFYYWDQGERPSRLGAPDNVVIWNMARDGTTFAGSEKLWGRPLKYSLSDGIKFLDGVSASRTVISSDGTVIAGDSNANVFLWSNSGNLWLSTLSGFDYASASAFSENGKVLVGMTWRKTDPAYKGNICLWSLENNTVKELEPFRDGIISTYVNAVTNDGRMAVGQTKAGKGGATVWRFGHGWEDLTKVAVEEYGLGEKLKGWKLWSAMAVSGNSTIVGSGMDPSGKLRGFVLDLR